MQMPKRFWKLISNYGERPFMATDEHRQNRILNHGLFYATVLYLVTYFIALGYFYFMLRADFSRYWPYFWPYTAATVIPALATAALFFVRARPGYAALATVAAYLVALLHNFTMLLYLGLSGGFQFFLAALIPAAYLAHPHRRLIYLPLYLVTIVALVGGVFWVLTDPPLYPIPEPFRSITFYTLIGTSSLFFIASFAYVAYKHDWVKRVMVYVRRLATYGSTSLSLDRRLGTGSSLGSRKKESLQTWHAISNQIWLWNMALSAAVIPLIPILVAVFGDLLGGKKWIYLGTYSAIPVGIFAVQVFLFWWGNRPEKEKEPGPSDLPQGQIVSRIRQGTGKRTLALHLIIASDCIMLWLFSIFTGGKAAIHFIFPMAIALPFYFFRSEIHRRARLTKAIWVLAILTQSVLAVLSYLQFADGRYLFGQPVTLQPLPAAITDVARVVVVVLMGLIAVIWVVYFWWQWQVTSRALAYWEKISYESIPTSIGMQLREWHSVANRIMFLVVVFWTFLYGTVIGVGLIQMLIRGESKAFVLAAIWNILPHYVACTGLNYIFFRFKISPRFYGLSTRSLNRWLNAVIFFNGILWFWPAFLYSIRFPLPLFAFLGLQLMILLKNTKFTLAHLLVAMALIGFGLGGFWVQFQDSPLFPAPAYLTVWASPITILAWLAAMISLNFYGKLESEKTKAAFEIAHQKSESLLLNILPRDVADELKDKGHSAPVRIESVTVMFTDFAGFTKISESLSPEQVVDELDKCFSYFDQIMEKYNLEKLKTIGDSYMCAGGIPKSNHTHAVDCCLAAMEIQSFMNQMKDIKAMQGLPYWELRLGIHTGPLVAGVVGHKKFAYDVWGDTVNTASRMESSGTTGKINISWATCEQVKFLFDCEHRGQVAAKNKGMIDMYYLKGLRTKYSTGGEGRGRVPNARFREIYTAIARGAKLVGRSG